MTPMPWIAAADRSPLSRKYPSSWVLPMSAVMNPCSMQGCCGVQ